MILSPNLLGTQMRHRGVDVGRFYLAAKAGGEKFTSEDEEVLELFASQAATAVVNARKHRDKRRTRADLGLAICKGLVEAHGVRIWADSEGDGLGARFTFTIPVAEEAGIGAATDIARSASHK